MAAELLVHLRGLDILAVRGANAIVRRKASVLDEARTAWASDILADASAQELVRCVVEASDRWGNSLPDDFPSILRSSSGPDPASRDMSQGLAALVRCGFVLVRGVPLSGVTTSTGRASMMGREFVRHEEGLGLFPYCPGDTSGVTVGPGYDLSGREPAEIVADLVEIDVSYEAANTMSLAIGKLGQDASDWIVAHPGILKLSALQSDQLMDRLIGRYESRVLKDLPDDLAGRLFQHEFDAMFSLAWNTRRYGRYDFNRCIRNCRFDAAASALMELVGGGPGIAGRRHREQVMFAQGSYMPKPMPRANLYDDDLWRQPSYSHA